MSKKVFDLLPDLLPESRMAVCAPDSSTLHLFPIYVSESEKRFARTSDGMVPLSSLKHFIREEAIPPRPIRA
jgi:hypothetical protein